MSRRSSPLAELAGHDVLGIGFKGPVQIVDVAPVKPDADDLDSRLATALIAAQGGSEGGFTEVYRLLSGKVAGYIRGRGVTDVDDVTNEVFIGAFRNLTTFDGGAVQFRAWLFGIAWNKSSDWHRIAARRPPTSELSADTRSHAHGGDSEADAMERFEENRIEERLASLTDDQRNVVLLRIVADLPIGHVATVLNKPVGAVKALQHRALAALRKEIGSEAVSPAVVVTNTGVR